MGVIKRSQLFSDTAVGLIARSRRQYADKLDQFAAEVRGYVDTLEQSRTFSPIVVPRLHLEQGEFTVRSDRAKLMTLRAHVGLDVAIAQRQVVEAAAGLGLAVLTD